jgi:putative DNA primase/helicase
VRRDPGQTAANDASKPNGSEPPTPPMSEAEIEKLVDDLSKLSPVALAMRLDAASERAGIRPKGVLEKLVKARQKEVAAESGGDAAGQGRAIELPDLEPWPAPVDGASILDALAAAIGEYVVINEVQTDAAILWAAHTFAHDISETSPKLVVKSPQKRSGKTRFVDVMARITCRPLPISGISAAALLRLIETHKPTLLVDEMDALMNGDKEMRETLRGIINSGFDRTAARFIKNVPLPGGGYEPVAFSSWCPQLFAGIGSLPDTIRDRSIEIAMERKPRDQKVKRLRRRDGAHLGELARKLKRWIADSAEALGDARPTIPDSLNDRAADAWEPLLAIADRAGGDWPKRARKAAIALSGDDVVEDDNVGTMLLSDIHDIFTTTGGRNVSSADMAKALGEMTDKPWSEWKNGKPMTALALSRLLKPYHITPGTVWLPSGKSLKGYRAEQFADAFSRYLPDPSLRAVRPSEPAEKLALSEISDPSGNMTHDGCKNGEIARKSAAPDGLTVENGKIAFVDDEEREAPGWREYM